MHSWRNEKFSLRGDFLLLTQFILCNSSTNFACLIHKKGAKNTEDQVDLGTIKVRIDQGLNWPMKMCELTKVEMTMDRVDYKPCICPHKYQILFFF